MTIEFFRDLAKDISSDKGVLDELRDKRGGIRGFARRTGRGGVPPPDQPDLFPDIQPLEPPPIPFVSDVVTAQAPRFQLPVGELTPLPDRARYVLSPNEYQPPIPEGGWRGAGQQELRKFEVSSRGLTPEEFTIVVDEWRERQEKLGNLDLMRESAKNLARYGYAESEEQALLSELADQAAIRLLGLPSDLAHKVSDRYVGIERELGGIQARAEPADITRQPFDPPPMVTDVVTAQQPPFRMPDPETLIRIKQEQGIPLSQEELQQLEDISLFGRQPAPPRFIRRPIAKAAEAAERVATAPLFSIAGVNVNATDIAAAGLLIFGAYLGIKSLVPITKGLADKALTKALNTGLDKWIAERSRGVPPQHLKRVQDFLYNSIAKDRIWLQQRATENMLERRGKIPNIAQATREAVADTVKDVEGRIASLVPRGTQTGALAFGGRRVPRVPPVTPAVTPTEPVVTPEVTDEIIKYPQAILTHITDGITTKTGLAARLATFTGETYSNLVKLAKEELQNKWDTEYPKQVERARAAISEANRQKVGEEPTPIPTQPSVTPEVVPEISRARQQIMAVSEAKGIDEVTRRDIFEKVTGKRQLTEMDAKELSETLKAVQLPSAGVPEVTEPQISPVSQAQQIALDKALINPETGKFTQQYRILAKNITGKTKIDEMSPDEVEGFIEALERYPEKKWSRKTGNWIPQSIPRTAELVAENFFNIEFGEPTPIKFLTSQNYYATKLGVRPLTEPLEVAKVEFDLAMPAWDKAIKGKIGDLNKAYGVTGAEKIVAFRNNQPTRAEKEMAVLLNTHEDLPAELVDSLGMEKVAVFSWFRNLSRTLLNGENQVRAKLNLPPIPHRDAYFRHIATATSGEILAGKYPLPSDLAFWSKKIVAKRVFNPMEIQRQMTDDLLKYFSKDLKYVTRSMLHTALKDIYLSQPLKSFKAQVNALGKGKLPFHNLSEAEMAKAESISVLPASTRQWMEDYVRINIMGQQTEFDASVNRLVTQSGLGGLLNKLAGEFGRNIGMKPVTKMANLSGRLIINSTIGTKPRQILRNFQQSTQNLALYGVRATLAAFLPADKTLTKILNDSLFLRSYKRVYIEEFAGLSKVEFIWMYAYGQSASFNAKTAMKASYHFTQPLVTKRRYAKLGWADPARTYTEPKGFLYPSEIDALSKEAEFGAGATQYQYIAMGMPEIFRHKTLVPLTRLQSWWMNYFFKFQREAFSRFWNGHVGWDKTKKLPWTARLNWLKYIILGGAYLTALGYDRSFGRDVLPYWAPPGAQLTMGLYGWVVADSDYQREKAKRQTFNSIRAFMPGLIDYDMYKKIWDGDEPISKFFFYGDDWPPHIPTWGIPPLQEEVDVRQRIKDSTEEFDEIRGRLGTTIPAEDGDGEYLYDMGSMQSDIRAGIRDIPPERVTGENGFDPLVILYKDSLPRIDAYYELPSALRQDYLLGDDPEAIEAGAYLVLWGNLKVTGWVSGNPKTVALVESLVKEHNIPRQLIFGEVTLEPSPPGGIRQPAPRPTAPTDGIRGFSSR